MNVALQDAIELIKLQSHPIDENANEKEISDDEIVNQEELFVINFVDYLTEDENEDFSGEDLNEDVLGLNENLNPQTAITKLRTTFKT